MSNLKNLIVRAVAERARALQPAAIRSQPTGYTTTPEANLLPGLDVDLIRQDYSGGDGGEWKGDLPKFCAAHSSAALAANVFGPFRRDPRLLNVGGLSGFIGARFERHLPTGLKGTPPNLDFYAAGPSGVLSVESKFTEILDAKRASFSPAYARVIDRLAEGGWEQLYRVLLDRPDLYAHLDAAQLIKHYLGVRHTLRDMPGSRVLCYVYWEPSNAEDFPEYMTHRAEVSAVEAAVKSSEVRFVPLSHAELWESWMGEAAWPGAVAHMSALKAKYELSVRESAI